MFDKNFQLGRVVRECLTRGKKKDYNKLLTGKETVPTSKEYENDVAKSTKQEREDIVRLNDVNKEAFEDIILSICHISKHRKVAFSLVKHKTAKYPEGNCKLKGKHSVVKYSSKTTPSLLKFRKNFLTAN